MLEDCCPYLNNKKEKTDTVNTLTDQEVSEIVHKYTYKDNGTEYFKSRPCH